MNSNESVLDMLELKIDRFPTQKLISNLFDYETS